ncbi:ABC transporter substrate-binding protein [Candidatus Woesearchaeota archaeon]|jgi:branched-chain amino acid transport system substrate-binding protein|nr:ABC transporter substrate-binding protein [Candidatus Woesearchaeota archaeon]MBT3537494.1 ABC transporter substrate-binding protein [Candidatus Woesearchaeota archaeon]MBT4697237.1 ABC transporter substrate-binding protein [Candidatus Woesearchaeota archaeon]MBT4717619.1 ABC transporter substrate-binding protein [Candidatus Woesearchaeota archaeon]MBT7106196.1 ABC transporter substrate-binding protein [Candidatus Woesearchaeota archaeon]
MRLKFILAVAILILIVGCGSNTISGKVVQKQTLEPIKIGAILPLSGAASFIGEPELDGMILAVEEINSDGGINGRELKLIVEDSQTNPVAAVKAANKLINLDNVDILYGTTTGASGAVAPFAQESNTVFIYESTTVKFATENDLVFGTYPNAYDFCKQAALLAIQEGKKRLALIALNFDASFDCKRGIEDATSNTDTTLVFLQMYEMEEKDFRTNLMRVKEENIDGLLLYSYSKNNVPLFQQALDLNINTTMICPLLTASCHGVDEIDALAKNTKILDGALGTNIPFDSKSDDPKMRAFVKRFKERFNKTLGVEEAFTYDDVYLIKEALTKCTALSTECIKESLLSTTLDGISGEIVFDKDGVATRDIAFVKFENKEWVGY